VNIGQKPTKRGPVRMTHRSPAARTFAADVTSKRHKAGILPDSSLQSKTNYPLQYLKGVGPARAEALAGMGLREVLDLAGYFPRGWEDRRVRFTIRDAPMGEKTVLRGVIRSVDFSMTRSNLGIATVVLEDKTGSINAVWFKRLTPRYDVFASLRQHLQTGKFLYVYGPIEWGPAGRQIRAEDMSVTLASDTPLGGDEQFHFERIVPLYTVPETLSERFLRSLIGRVVTSPTFSPPDLIPVTIKGAWPSRTWAMTRIHFPKTLVEKEQARELLAFEEFLVLETALGRVRRAVQQHPKVHRYTLHRNLLTPFREHLGFEFTLPQKRVIREIFDDMMKPEPMNRLLQGDVGSGKTVIALSAMLLAVENGGQAALMAPTEILAEQHALTFGRFLQGLSVRTALISGRQAPSQKKKILEDIASGRIDLVIGTHALIQKQVRFSQLMLAVIDEQHRFGVEHRGLLREKGRIPDILVMTATPIPRTLALTVYGDLDVSVLEGLPPGRSPITTVHVPEAEAYRRVRQAVSRGQQAYVVYPLVSESDKLELKAAVQEATLLQQTTFKDLRVGVLHGQLAALEKETVMEQFRRGKIDVLIATTIIEVGIDVPNATVMMIQHAERFGLSTLHQLRGRVGRGPNSSQCLLVADVRGDDARKRIQIMTRTTDGFVLSEEDLALRGPGEVLGAMQHGIPVFKLGNLLGDARLIQAARHAAENLLVIDPDLKNPGHAGLKAATQSQYGVPWTLTP
jgi:ATP-dependent DNA helicase RecG